MPRTKLINRVCFGPATLMLGERIAPEAYRSNETCPSLGGTKLSLHSVTYKLAVPPGPVTYIGASREARPRPR